ncbi:MAG: hypothetical protein QXL15_04130 [Candidatus Korarchaeota archaeon]
MENLRRIFRPQPFSKLLLEMKESIDDMLDLSFAAILFGNNEIIANVQDLNTTIDDKRYGALLSLTTGSRDRDDAIEMLILFDVIEFLDNIAQGAVEFLKVSETGLNEYVARAIADIGYAITSYEIKEKSPLLVDEFEEKYPEVDIIGVWKNGKLITKNIDAVSLRHGDKVLLSGPLEAVSTFAEPKIPAVESCPIMQVIKDLIDVAYSLPSLAFAYMASPEESLLNVMKSLCELVDAAEKKIAEMFARKEIEITEKLFLGIIHLLRGTVHIKNAIEQLLFGFSRKIEMHEIIAKVLNEAENITLFVKFTDEMLNSVARTPRDFRRIGIDLITATVDGQWRRLLPPGYNFKPGDRMVVYGHKKRLYKLIKRESEED